MTVRLLWSAFSCLKEGLFEIRMAVSTRDTIIPYLIKTKLAVSSNYKGNILKTKSNFTVFVTEYFYSYFDLIN